MNVTPSIIVVLIIIPTNREQQYKDYQREINMPGQLCADCGADMVKPDHILDGFSFCHDCFCALDRCAICEEPALKLQTRYMGRVCIECINI